MRRILLILTVAALMAAFLAFGSSGVAFGQDEPAVVADDFIQEKSAKSRTPVAAAKEAAQACDPDDPDCIETDVFMDTVGESEPATDSVTIAMEGIIAKDLPKTGGPSPLSALLPATALLLVSSTGLLFAILRRR